MITIGLALLIVSLSITDSTLTWVGLSFMFTGAVALIAGINSPLGRLR